jgi:hypothetical protein
MSRYVSSVIVMIKVQEFRRIYLSVGKKMCWEEHDGDCFGSEMEKKDF